MSLILPLLLATIESFVYIFLQLLLDIPIGLITRTLFLYLVLMLVYGHFSVRTSLIWDSIKEVSKAMFIYFVVACVFLEDSSWYVNVLIHGGTAIFMLAFSVLLNRTLRVRLRRLIARKTLIIGDGNEAIRYLKITRTNRFALTNVIGIVSLDSKNKCRNRSYNVTRSSDINSRSNVKVYAYDELDEIILSKKINQIVIILPEERKEVLDEVMSYVSGKVPHIKFFTEGAGLITFSTIVQDFDGMLLVSTSRVTINLFQKTIKRVVDILAAIVGCLLVVPLGIYIKYKYIKSGDNDSIFFTQERIGKDGKPIMIYKFRTMVPNAEAILEKLMKEEPKIKEEYLLNKKLQNDPRITSIGKKLRSTSLDEFPQFLNVLKGEMSLVGPRPYLFREQEDMGGYIDAIVSCKPGITGMWQANGRSDVGFMERCKLDEYYYHNWNLSLDFVILYKTFRGVLYGKGAL